MGGQRGFHIGLAEGDAGLAQILAIGAQQLDLAPLQAGQQNQPVEAVAFHAAHPGAAQRGLESLAHGIEIDAGAAGRGQREIVQMQARRLAAALAQRKQRMGHFGQHPQAHVLQQRQHVGKRNRIAFAQQLEPQILRPVAVLAIERYLQFARSQRPFGPFDVLQRGGGRNGLLVAGRKAVRVTARQGQTMLLAEIGDQRFLQPIAPGAGRLRQLRFEGVAVPGARRLAQPDAEQHAGQRRFVGQRHRVGQHLAAEGAFEDAGELLAQDAVVAFARGEDEAGNGTAQRVGPHEQRRARPFLQMQDAQHRVEQGGVVVLQQLVARKRLEDVQRRLAVMGVRLEAGRLDGARHLAAQQRYGARRAIVGGRGEQAGEAMLALQPAVGTEMLDDQHIHRRAAMHRRLPIGLGQHQDRWAVQEGPHRGRQPRSRRARFRTAVRSRRAARPAPSPASARRRRRRRLRRRHSDSGDSPGR